MCNILVQSFLLLIVVCSVTAIPILPFNDGRDDGIAYRLPNNTRPIKYEISLTTNIHKNDLKFTGVAVIYLEVVETTSSIILHAYQLKITTGELSIAWSSSNQFNIELSQDKLKEIVEVRAQQSLPAGYVLKLKLEFEGVLSAGGGFYRTSYKNTRNENIYLATTQFEAVNARRAFPCYDEPQLKAIFDISITHGKYYGAISNMPVLGDIIDNGDGTATTKFEPTRLISSYLIAFTVSNYEFSEKMSAGVNGIPHRIYSKPGYTKQHVFALDTSVATLNSLNDYLGVKYPLPKMDNVAIPGKGGAMENWGMVTYGEPYLLYDDKETTTTTKTTIASIIAHEFAHQWFGDYVSPKWWTYTWLNEGFASLFEYVTTDAVFPEWDIMQKFVTAYFQGSLASDTSKSPRAMTTYIESPRDISRVFDYVSYGKAASVLRMIQHAVTERTFQKTLNAYLKERDYQSAQEEDLFKSFKDATYEDNTFNGVAVDLDGMLKSWTNQGGFPLITVTRDYNSGTFAIKQEPFDGSEAGNTSDTRSWWVPYNFATAMDPNFKSTNMEGYLLPGTTSAAVHPNPAKSWTNSDWVILNKQVTSYYRVNYDIENWNLLSKALIADVSKIHVHNRAQLLDDAYRLRQAKRLNWETLLYLMSFLKNEVEYAPWTSASNIVSRLNDYLAADPQYKLFQFFIRTITENFFKSVGLNEVSTDTHLKKLIRSTAINWACQSQNHECLDGSKRKLKDFLQNGSRIEPNLRSSIMCTGMMSAGEFELNVMLQKLKFSEVQLERVQILSGIGCISDANLLRIFLETSIADSSVTGYSNSERSNIVGYVVVKGATAVKASIDFLLANHTAYAKLSTNLTQNNPVLEAIRSIAQRVYTDEQLTHLETLLERVKAMEGITSSSLDSVRNTVASNINWMKENRKDIIEWMSKYYKDNGGKEEVTDGATTIAAATSVIATIVLASSLYVFCFKY